MSSVNKPFVRGPVPLYESELRRGVESNVACHLCVGMQARGVATSKFARNHVIQLPGSQ